MGLGSLFAQKNNSSSSSTSPYNNTPSGETPLFSRATSITSSRRHRTQMEELELVFKKFDLNNDGKISTSELGSIMESLGQPATSSELRKILKEADRDRDGSIDFQEFVELNTKGVNYDEVMESLKDAFSVFDIDGNGLISAEELHEVLHGLGEESSVAECRKMIGGVDVNGDGLISFDEFKVMMDSGSRFDAKDRAPVNVE